MEWKERPDDNEFSSVPKTEYLQSWYLEPNIPIWLLKEEMNHYLIMPYLLGLKSMAGDQIPAPTNPRNGDNVTINVGRPMPPIRSSFKLDLSYCYSFGVDEKCFGRSLFPAVTGIMAGSNRSASLEDTQRSIPVGSLAATLTTSGLYLVSVLLFGALATREKLLTDRLLTATVAWPFPAMIYIGIILSSLGAALQSLTDAPRLLAAIANDDILPVLNYFKVADGSEPHIATLFTAFFCIGCVVIGNLDLITPIMLPAGVLVGNFTTGVSPFLEHYFVQEEIEFPHAHIFQVIMFLISLGIQCGSAIIRSKLGAPKELVSCPPRILLAVGQIARECTLSP
ncbi:hypothetical protein Pfo_012606 [Paulownia fortunei]|nr:hypothetical protein Pfo_012606 [Paulownia fortunei]